MNRFFILIFLVGSLLFSCDSEKDECVFQPDVSSKIKLDFESLEESFVNIESKDDLVKLLTQYPAIRDYIFRRDEYPNDSTFINVLYNRFTSPHIDTLLLETKRVFGDLSPLKAEFEEAFTNLKYYYPNFVPPKIKTVISGIDTDLFVTDSLIVVSLDYYLGRGAKYRPDKYEYLLRKYDPNDIVPSSLLIYGISNRFNNNEIKDQTILADMITYGKAFYFAKHMLPCVADSVFLSYTPEEVSGSRKNENLIWARFVESQVLFSTNQKMKQDYLGERPITIQVGEKCPGRIGQWVGWQIVNKYAQTHTDITLPNMMAMKDAQKIFKESKYKPN